MRNDKATGGWRAIPGFPGYAVDLNGEIWSVGSNWRGLGARQLARHGDPDGYWEVRLTVNGRRIKKKAHVLVALAVLGPRPSPRHEVRHLNGCKIDNHPTNLAWGTRAENAADRDRHGRTARGERNGASKLTGAAVNLIRQRAAGGERHGSIGRDFGVTKQAVQLICSRKGWGHV